MSPRHFVGDGQKPMQRGWAASHAAAPALRLRPQVAQPAKNTLKMQDAAAMPAPRPAKALPHWLEELAEVVERGTTPSLQTALAAAAVMSSARAEQTWAHTFEHTDGAEQF